ncbi:8-oxo-dGTP diphosphatase [Dysgonomonas sp. PH5-45]|uniref:NUDIX hydrolase n=1 Tax=unclassified Dysgonomonas TaxID=2630389 RepID=UPI002476C1F8|nr:MULTISPECIES: NUDIX hydrolase [unclassified Dysgonomonas]MDH6354561.1 8-oxo-dGTP diphosphatase [Dysgonomonas sp. PH5-45]MDH6387383.1 8-oxo-dGTP diphosphatase [Dysgonomonas sp. PH5-37]
MEKTNPVKSFSSFLKDQKYQPGIFIACVTFGFQDGLLKVLLNRYGSAPWMLPVGFIYRDEDIDTAAKRILESRTSFTDIYLKQFSTFGSIDAIHTNENVEFATLLGIGQPEIQWFEQRFITIGYYSFVNIAKVKIESTHWEEENKWFAINDLPPLRTEHDKMIQYALESIRNQMGNIPIGYQLLPEKFTMPELRLIYEAILGRELDRRNFQRKMLSTGLMKKLSETKKCGSHKSPFLYTFNHEKYAHSMEFDLPLMTWKI